MNIRVYRKMAEKIGYGKELESFGVYARAYEGYNKDHGVDVAIDRWDHDRCMAFAALLERAVVKGEANGAKKAIEDIRRWVQYKAGDRGLRPKSLREFASMLIVELSGRAGHRLWRQSGLCALWLPYFVGRIEWHPEQRGRNDERIPERVSMDFHWVELGRYKSSVSVFEAGDVIGRTIQVILESERFWLETAELWQAYAASMVKFDHYKDRVGTQMEATGIALDDLDGNGESRHSWAPTMRLPMDVNGDRSRVVVDVFVEETGDSHGSNYAPSQYFWSDCVASEDREIEYERIREGQLHCLGLVPVHPVMAFFDLRRHVRVRMYSTQVEEHEYDLTLSDKLVLPDEHRSLIKMLLEHRGVFRDVVKGKGGGVIVLAAGSPGTGKTLTAEVFSESSRRPLFSVQCSQLGMNADELENALRKAFARAQRWSAILLLDEADVYVSQRGSSLVQNAIVGVFLRVLEYYEGVMFMTTNRADCVDDAVASRCIARLNYQTPPIEDQAKLWRILADAIGVKVTQEVILELVTVFRGLSGRDIKNLLKLSSLMMASSGEEFLTAKTVRYVKQFKPTWDENERGIQKTGG